MFLTNANERVWHAPACSVDACTECVRHLQRFLEQLNSCNPVSNFWNIPEGILEVSSCTPTSVHVTLILLICTDVHVSTLGVQ